MSLVERLRERLEELRLSVLATATRLRLRKPEEEEGWGTLEEAPEEKKPEPRKLRVVLGEWLRWRWRVLGIISAVNVAVNLGLMVLLYSSTWYMNLIIFLFLIPNTAMLLHYRRLLGRMRAEFS